MRKKLVLITTLILFVLSMFPQLVIGAEDFNRFKPYDLTVAPINPDQTHPYGSVLLTVKIDNLPRSTDSEHWSVNFEKKIGDGPWIGTDEIPSERMLDEHQKSTGLFTLVHLWIDDEKLVDSKVSVYRVNVKKYDYTWSFAGQSNYSNEASKSSNASTNPPSTSTNTDNNPPAEKPVSGTTPNTDAKQEVIVVVNGKPVESDALSFINTDNRTMVTLRAIAEALGAKVEWDAATQTITITLEDRIIMLVIGQNNFSVNGENKVGDTAPEISNGRTMVPARTVAEGLGANVGWNAETKTVSVSSGTPGTSTQPSTGTDWKAKFPLYPSQGDNFTDPNTYVRTNGKLSESGLFEANTTITFNASFTLKTKITLRAFDNKGNTLFVGDKEFELKESMPLGQWTLQVPADVMPKVAEVKLEQLKLSSASSTPAGNSSNNMAGSSPEPLKAYDKKQLNPIGTFNMESNAVLDLRTGNLQVTTKTWSSDPLLGFPGAVQVRVLDANRKTLWKSSVKNFNVDSKGSALFGGHPDREDHWEETVPSDVLVKATTLKIVHAPYVPGMSEIVLN